MIGNLYLSTHKITNNKYERVYVFRIQNKFVYSYNPDERYNWLTITDDKIKLLDINTDIFRELEAPESDIFHELNTNQRR